MSWLHNPSNSPSSPPSSIQPLQARMLLTSTSEVYGDPEVHPQKETYWGNVNPIGAYGCTDTEHYSVHLLQHLFSVTFVAADVS